MASPSDLSVPSSMAKSARMLPKMHVAVRIPPWLVILRVASFSCAHCNVSTSE